MAAPRNASVRTLFHVLTLATRQWRGGDRDPFRPEAFPLDFVRGRRPMTAYLDAAALNAALLRRRRQHFDDLDFVQGVSPWQNSGVGASACMSGRSGSSCDCRRPCWPECRFGSGRSQRPGNAPWPPAGSSPEPFAEIRLQLSGFRAWMAMACRDPLQFASWHLIPSRSIGTHVSTAAQGRTGLSHA